MQKQKLTHLILVILALAMAGVAMPAHALTQDELIAKLQTAGYANVSDIVAVHPPASETLRGVVDRVDERNDTLLIRLSAGRTEPFRVQDGLIFNAVRFGDPVEISVQTISGFPTIVGLKKE
ncbi:hypothetical protein [Bradyrhizobium sp. Ce-3]|uniref:hypothetical protein n=1 Tax=Bradyrhizobium sp. Ce-3 TaxID=2913970 RepID=UPI001FC8E64D|nr:hypothetical protein [Bradyrhizobium sp. Ce-3]GKQ53449.1 hypothetical protein BRSPCE3_43040 [Bradyrhizobium sp. Ce-3]